jgi:hypothetical protein
VNREIGGTYQKGAEFIRNRRLSVGIARHLRSLEPDPVRPKHIRH